MTLIMTSQHHHGYRLLPVGSWVWTCNLLYVTRHLITGPPAAFENNANSRAKYIIGRLCKSLPSKDPQWGSFLGCVRNLRLTLFVLMSRFSVSSFIVWVISDHLYGGSVMSWISKTCIYHQLGKKATLCQSNGFLDCSIILFHSVWEIKLSFNMLN